MAIAASIWYILLRQLFNWLITGTAVAAAFISCLVLVEIYKANLAYLDFKRKSNGLIMMPKRSIISNHTLSACLSKNSLAFMWNFLKEKNIKTFGFIMHNKFAAITIDADLMKKVMLDDPNKNINRCNIHVPLAEYMEDSIMLAKDDQWRRLRRAVAPALKSSKFKAPNVRFEFEASVGKLIEAIEEKLNENEKANSVGVNLNVNKMTHRFATDLVFRCFYKRYDVIDFKAEHCDVCDNAHEAFSASMTSIIFKLALIIHPLAGPIDWLGMKFHSAGKWRRDMIGFVRDQTKQSLEARKQLKKMVKQGKKVDRDNFVLKDGTRFQRNLADHITDHLIDGKINQSEYLNTMGFLMNAAERTTGDSLVYTLYRLAIDSATQDKLRKSIRSEGSDSVYLDWVVSESLRLMPTAPGAGSRVIVEDMELGDGTVLPAGTFVVYPTYIVHRLKEYWGEDADQFRPERFAKADEFHPMQYAPFGAGIRGCPGRELAIFEMKELLSKLLVRYKFHCEIKDDADVFDSPFLVFVLYNSPTYIKITRV